MPNVVSVLRDEIRRLARKEIRAEVGTLKKDNVRLKKDVAQLKREVAELNRDTARIKPEVAKLRRKSVDPEAKAVQQARFGPKLIAALRRKLKLSRHSFASIAGVSANTIYLWEKGKTSPSSAARAVLIELRSIGVREARQRVKEAS